ncbi:ABZJ_00895 family protein [Aminobacter sp. MDW-2]|uniref:ABZJ_00895 family protein n=1 Tax=Aminobacter sp. MDW-2 TaxID=2666139 RepID=UPI0012B0083F|nr:ABZJ_00895 family protein [Aminobacter sp. MDW-2]MRX37155.1 hypothetical protein [Aminobacter sp. MDW-2]QNH33294.1 hypothetical protein H5P29_22705 [Aminobacter sp. MDW-2]
MQTSLWRYILMFGALTAAAPFVASVLVQALPGYAKTIEDIFGIPIAFAITQSTAYHFFFRTKRLPTTGEYWRLVGACTAVGTGLGLVSILLTDAFAGMPTGMIAVAIGMMVAVQAAVLAIAFSSFMGRSFLKHVEKAAAKQASTGGR